MAADSDRIPLRDHFESLLHAHTEVHTIEHIAIDRAREVVDSRLDALNELRREVTLDRALYLRNDVYDQRHASLEAQIDRLRAAFNIADQAAATHFQLAVHPGTDIRLSDQEIRIRSLEVWRNRAAGAAVVLVLLAGTLGAAIAKVFGA